MKKLLAILMALALYLILAVLFPSSAQAFGPDRHSYHLGSHAVVSPGYPACESSCLQMYRLVQVEDTQCDGNEAIIRYNVKYWDSGNVYARSLVDGDGCSDTGLWSQNWADQRVHVVGFQACEAGNGCDDWQYVPTLRAA